MNVLLTSAGFENPKFGEMFLSFINKKPEDIKILFVTAAAITASAKAVLPKCKADLTNLGITENNICECDLSHKITHYELALYDGIYVCGGSTDYLMEKINKIHCRGELIHAINCGLPYVGVSAGSCIASSKLNYGLGLIANEIHPHAEKGSATGALPPAFLPVYLTDKQAIYVTQDGAEIIE